jgi:CheY-like chemotaxis protein/HAMP domain-containing protein
VNPYLRRILLRLGLTGKLLLHVGWILALSLGLLVGLTYRGAGRTIRAELQKTERVRVLRWAVDNLAHLETDNRWELAKAIRSLAGDPYVTYAGLFDKAGMPIAHTGDEDSRARPHSLVLLVELRSREIREFAQVPPGEAPPPLPGLISSPEEASPGATFKERFGAVLGDLGHRSEDLVGFVEITMSTEPLDTLASRVLGPLALLAALLFLAGTGWTFLLVRRMTAPIRMLREQADEIASGQTDLPFHEIPRPLDEVGDLATHFSVMARIIERSRAKLEDHVSRREESLREERSRLRKVAHDLRNPIGSILAFAEILQEDPPPSRGEARNFLERIRSEAERLSQAVASLDGAGETEPGKGLAAARGLPSRILVVSEDGGLREVLREDLVRDGFHVREAAVPASVMDEVGRELPDAILLDLFMEGGAAFQVMMDLREEEETHGIPVLPLAVLRDGDRFEAGEVLFRAKPIPRSDLLAAVHAAASSRDRDRQEGRRVLVVDDDRFLAEGICSVLAGEGFRAESSGGGEEALRSAAGDPPALILLDLAMPGLDGIEVLRRLRARPKTRHTPVILMTGHAIPAGSAVPWKEPVLGPQTFTAGIRAALRSMARG